MRTNTIACTVLFCTRVRHLVLQVLEESGLSQYVDPAVVHAEILEAAELSPEEMEEAAAAILERSQAGRPPSRQQSMAASSASGSGERSPSPVAVSVTGASALAPHESFRSAVGDPADEMHADSRQAQLKRGVGRSSVKRALEDELDRAELPLALQYPLAEHRISESSND